MKRLFLSWALAFVADRLGTAWTQMRTFFSGEPSLREIEAECDAQGWDYDAVSLRNARVMIRVRRRK